MTVGFAAVPCLLWLCSFFLVFTYYEKILFFPIYNIYQDINSRLQHINSPLPIILSPNALLSGFWALYVLANDLLFVF